MRRDYYTRPRPVDKHDALGPGSSFLHWFACLVACTATIFCLVGSELSLFHFASSKFPRGGNLQLLSNNISGQVSDKKDYTPDGVMVQLHVLHKDEELPFSARQPFAFLVAVHLLMGVSALMIHGLIILTWKAIGLPSSVTIRRRLREGRSNLGRSLGYIMEQYDDAMVDGVMGRPGLVQGLSVLGGVSLLALLYRYLWCQCMEVTDTPFTQVISYMYIICVPLFSFWILREPLHGLKAMSALLCFIGIYLYFFAHPPVSPLPATASARVLGALQGIGGAICLGLYLVIYRYFNPAGSMILVVAYEGIGGGLAGLSILAIRWMLTGAVQVPVTSEDFLLILYAALWSLCICVSINEALRWGQPTGVAAAIVVAPVMSAVLRALVGSAPMTHEYFYAVSFTSSGFAVDMLYQFVLATRKRRERNRILATKDRQEDVEAEERLLIGQEYTL